MLVVTLNQIKLKGKKNIQILALANELVLVDWGEIFYNAKPRSSIYLKSP